MSSLQNDQLLQLETTCGSLLYELQLIWDEMGEPDEERHKMLLQLEQECLEIYKRKVDQSNRAQAQLHQAIADSKAELASIYSTLGVCPTMPKQGDRRAGSLKEQLAAISTLLEEMPQRKEEGGGSRRRRQDCSIAGGRGRSLREEATTGGGRRLQAEGRWREATRSQERAGQEGAGGRRRRRSAARGGSRWRPLQEELAAEMHKLPRGKIPFAHGARNLAYLKVMDLQGETPTA